MTLEIDRGKTTFRYAFSVVEDLKAWLDSQQDLTGFCFAGRSNVGKSSLINSLFGNGTARTSKTPGRTREINIFSFQLLDNENDEEPKLYYLFDLPGYGFAKVSKEMSQNWHELIGTVFGSITEKVGVVNLQDARHPNLEADFAFHDFLKNYDLPTFLAFNKIDKLKRQKDRASLEKLKPKLFSEYEWVKQIHFVSAEKRKGVPKLEEALVDFLLEFEK
ncbi:MAG: ribosome biogenesis GTP-binding protein YsxC [Halobacteriovoraceae bacterium]|jgi:GTP-binding protein|nr:ribosome biogenesis GTP-binding protein YsxC [Halobacteriovoraceae bacterium]MBT5093324.1 ribosome biogenesis GTP-binding protein YsxC [Halobacteriovoraceae bacterium]